MNNPYDSKGTIDYVDMLENFVANTIEMLAFCISGKHMDMVDYYINQCQRFTDESADMVSSLPNQKPQ